MGPDVVAMIDLHVGEIVTEGLVTVTEAQSLTEAAVAMTDANIKSVIVVDGDDRPVGILTSTDFVEMAADGSTPPESSVSDYMTGDIVTTSPQTTVSEAADLMVDDDISHLPVVDDDDRLTGIVTTTDVAAYVSGLDELLPE